MENNHRLQWDPASFRDPSSRVFASAGAVVRYIYSSYFPEYDHLMKSGLYKDLVEAGLMIPHREVKRDQYCITISPEVVPFISYPYEWSFRQLSVAAFNTLQINRIAMKHGMMLKDASAYNMQVVKDRMCLIDTCSFMKYQPGMPWGPYSQFLRHFLGPMLLIKHFNPYTALKLLQTNIDGIPVPLVARLMPFSTRFNAGMWAHIFSQSLKFAVDPKRSVTMNQMVLTTLLDNLQKFVGSLSYQPPAGDFLQYAELGSYSHEALADKHRIVKECLGMVKGTSVLDLGCNTGDYSVMAAESGKQVISIDSNHDCIHAMHQNYTLAILPLVVDLCQPSPGIGWANRERKPFWDRVGKVDCIMALAIIHHLCLKNNIPLDMVVYLLKDHARSLIIEWVPPEDKKSQLLLGQKKVPTYDHQSFIKAFTRYYVVNRADQIKDSARIIYFMEGRK
jgi:SAM-dependent methyltransferase